MATEGRDAPAAEALTAAFEHSITWEDDLWRADPVDVEAIHAPARRKFQALLEAVTGVDARGQPRILLLHGQSGAGKTHLIRALRTAAHRAGRLLLANADLKDDGNLRDVAESAVVYKNAVFHFVRVDV